MSVSGLQTGLTPEMLRTILRKSDEKELLFLLEVALNVSGNAEYSEFENFFHQFVRRGDHLSTGGRVLFLLLLQLGRKRRKSTVNEGLEATRQILSMKEDLLAQIRSRSRFPADEQDTCTTPEEESDPENVSTAVIEVYRNFMGRTPSAEEVGEWTEHVQKGLPFHRFVNLMALSPEAGKRRELLPACGNGRFIQVLYEVLLNRGAFAWEIGHWLSALESGLLSRTDILRQAFEEAFNQLDDERTRKSHDPYAFQFFDSGERVTIDDWLEKERHLDEPESDGEISETIPSRFYIKTKPEVLVTAIASLYKGGRYIQQFLDNITSQSIFSDYCELIIVDANSPEGESEIIEKYTKQHKNIIYKHINYRIGIYDAWNIGIECSSGKYITNTNLDDLRRSDSLELQASTLDSLPFVDVVYQDFYYTFDPNISFRQIARFGYKSRLPVITPYNLMSFNSPHNAPMWRRSLHDELGLFDTTFKSAGDYEFWMRCLAAGKTFFKLNEPSVAYYQNPEGISTKLDTTGLEESKRIVKTYARKLISKNIVSDCAGYLSKLGAPIPAPLRNRSRYGLAQVAIRGMAADFKRRINDVREQQ